mmetsp:Transcript_67238/g.152059  ORF Transcript_67238/g.152059 Transcript_67238/m.152059 type:complete len:282 (+) Transcript_67238:162-1007(+)
MRLCSALERRLSLEAGSGCGSTESICIGTWCGTAPGSASPRLLPRPRPSPRPRSSRTQTKHPAATRAAGRRGTPRPPPLRAGRLPTAARTARPCRPRLRLEKAIRRRSGAWWWVGRKLWSRPSANGSSRPPATCPPDSTAATPTPPPELPPPPPPTPGLPPGSRAGPNCRGSACRCRRGSETRGRRARCGGWPTDRRSAASWRWPCYAPRPPRTGPAAESGCPCPGRRPAPSRTAVPSKAAVSSKAAVLRTEIRRWCSRGRGARSDGTRPSGALRKSHSTT